MARYRLTVEFEADGDSEARSLTTAKPMDLPAGEYVSLEVQRTYWGSVGLQLLEEVKAEASA